MSEHRGSCLCGTVTFNLEGGFAGFYLCHCQYCQKDTGSAHAANLFSPSGKLSWLSGEDAVTTFTLPNTRHRKGFCKHCGSALPSLQMDGSLVVVPAGCLDTAISVQPTAHIFMASKANWESALENTPQFAGMPK